MPPRLNKAQLELANLNLQRQLKEASQELQAKVTENNELKKRISRGHDRSRSPRMPATSSQANVDMTCKALNQVRLWQRDDVLKERMDEIERLRAVVAEKDRKIDFYRRGEGPVGPVLVHARRLSNARAGYTPSDPSLVEDMLNKGTRPAHEYFSTMNRVLRDAADVMSWGGCVYPTAMPRIQ